MQRGWVTLAAVLGAALPVLAQESNEDLRKEVEKLKSKVEAMEAKKAPAEELVPKLDTTDTTVLDVLMRETKLGGFIDVGYTWNANRPKNADGTKATNVVRAFDNDPNSFYLHNAQLELKRDPTKEVIVGYDIRLMLGSDAGAADAQSIDDNVAVQQANIQILTPIGDGVTWKIGKMATLAGAEVIESKDNYNYSRSLNFLYAIPFLHTGVRGTYMLADGKVGVTLGVNNGWDNQVDNNFGKTLEAQLAVTPVEWLSAYLNFYFGDEAVGGALADEDEKRTLIDIVVVLQNIASLKGLSIIGNIDIGSQEESSVANPGDEAEWMGFSLAGKYQINDIWAGAVRYSMLDDKESFRVPASAAFTGGVKYSEFTFTIEAKPVKDLITRLELRIDKADEDVFLDGKDADDSQMTIGMEAILVFN